MPSEFPMNDPRNIWQNQPTEGFKMSAAELHLRAQKFEKRISRRNLREYVASAIVIAVFGYYISLFPSTLTRTGCVLIIAGTLFMVWALHKRGAARTMPAGLEFRSCVEFHRQELQRQRDLLRGIWWWYLFPFVPGLIVFSRPFEGAVVEGTKRFNTPGRDGHQFCFRDDRTGAYLCGYLVVESMGGKQAPTPD